MRYCLNYSGTRFLTTENKNYLMDSFLTQLFHLPVVGYGLAIIISDGASASGIIVLFTQNANKVSMNLPDFIYFSASKNFISDICV